MKTEKLENCYASHKTEDATRKAIFVNVEGEEVIAVTDDDLDADYYDWLYADYYEDKHDD